MEADFDDVHGLADGELGETAWEQGGAAPIQVSESRVNPILSPRPHAQLTCDTSDVALGRRRSFIVRSGDGLDGGVSLGLWRGRGRGRRHSSERQSSTQTRYTTPFYAVVVCSVRSAIEVGVGNDNDKLDERPQWCEELHQPSAYQRTSVQFSSVQFPTKGGGGTAAFCALV